ncbi:ABC transporter permease subunit [Leifsonia sp. NPDC080035]|uniref:ABC transporter permease subunit n=1 Tax=Leifsonia sp. NPDC080035 TaxID=3143936 RepID=A0AAU7GB13_9MICO
MSTATAAVQQHPHSSLGRLSFPRVVRSEWIKLRSLRSTFWTLVAVVVIVVGLAALLSAVVPNASTLGAQVPPAQLADFVTNTATSGLMFAQLVVAVLGVLVISGEFSTGMIRSSFAAVPRRFPVLAAKAIVLFLTSFIVGLVSIAISWAIAVPMLTGKGYTGDLFTQDTLWAILGAALYLGLVAVFALGIGTIVKASAGGIAAALGVLFLLPILASLFGNLMNQKWVTDASHYLISNAGTGMSGGTNGTLEPWANVVTVLVWAAVSFILGAILLQRRDA